MNLLLLTAEEVRPDGRATVTGRRAEHLRTVLRVVPGRELRVGLLDGPLGTARVESTGDDAIELHCRFDTVSPPRSDDSLLLAVPRPKVLQRMLEHAAALGFGRIVLFRSWRVDKSHLAARVTEPETSRRHLIAGLEQARRTAVPQVHLFPLFKPFVEDHLDTLVPRGHRYVAHPAAPLTTASLRYEEDAPFALALGPEGGFIPYEIEALQASGFTPISLGTHPLRNESALSVLHGQLDLLRRRRRRG